MSDLTLAFRVSSRDAGRVGRRGAVAGARHRRQHGDLLAGQQPAAARAAGEGTGTARRSSPTTRSAASPWTNPIWEQIRDRRDLFDGAFAWSTTRFNLAAGGRDAVRRRHLGERPHLRHARRAGDARPHVHRRRRRRGGGPDGPVAVISYRFWQRRFGGAATRSARSLDRRTRALHDRRRDAARISSGPTSAAPSTSRSRSAPSRSSAASENALDSAIAVVARRSWRG